MATWECFCVISTVWDPHCGNCRNSLSHFFPKNFVKAMVLLKKLLNSWFDEIFFQWERIFRFSTLCVIDSQDFSAHSAKVLEFFVQSDLTWNLTFFYFFLGSESAGSSGSSSSSENEKTEKAPKPAPVRRASETLNKTERWKNLKFCPKISYFFI